jgi:hypothetical protein
MLDPLMLNQFLQLLFWLVGLRGDEIMAELHLLI